MSAPNVIKFNRFCVWGGLCVRCYRFFFWNIVTCRFSLFDLIHHFMIISIERMLKCKRFVNVQSIVAFECRFLVWFWYCDCNSLQGVLLQNIYHNVYTHSNHPTRIALIIVSIISFFVVFFFHHHLIITPRISSKSKILVSNIYKGIAHIVVSILSKIIN